MDELKVTEDVPAVVGTSAEMPWFKIDHDGMISCDNYGLLPEELVIPSVFDGVKVIGIADKAFHLGYAGRVQEVRSIVISDGISIIGNGAFMGMIGVESVSIPESVTDVGIDAFGRCDNLRCADHDDVLYLGNPENPYMVLIAVTLRKSTYRIHPSTRVIDGAAFAGIHRDPYQGEPGLRRIVIPEGVTYICERAFADDSALHSVKLPSTLLSIGENAFSNCRNLRRIYIPESVKTVGQNAFEKCESLKICAAAGARPFGWYQTLKGSWNPLNRPVKWGASKPLF